MQKLFSVLPILCGAGHSVNHLWGDIAQTRFMESTCGVSVSLEWRCMYHWDSGHCAGKQFAQHRFIRGRGSVSFCSFCFKLDVLARRIIKGVTNEDRLLACLLRRKGR